MIPTPPPVPIYTPVNSTIAMVPFFSQFTDITSPQWKKVGCGVTSLAMVIDYYRTEPVSVDTLLKAGIAAKAYDYNAGWTYAGLIGLSKTYGLQGQSYDLAKKGSKIAFESFKTYLSSGPIIASVHYKFDPKSTIPHLVVINGIKDGMLTYNDPAAKDGNKQISTADFLKAWKMRFIVIRPAEKKVAIIDATDDFYIDGSPIKTEQYLDHLFSEFIG